MAGAVHIGSAGRAEDYQGQGLSAYVVLVCIVASLGGFLTGYDLGVTGGTEANPNFLQKFFPSVYEEKQSSEISNPYCRFNDQMLQLFTSSIYLSAGLACLLSGHLTRTRGRKLGVFLGGLCFMLGSILNCVAENLATLICGRLIMGLGIGFASQAIPIYLTEVAPARLRGGVTVMNALAMVLGILVAQLMNYALRDWPESWRLTLGLPAGPALVICLTIPFLPESPNSLIQRDRREQGRKVLEKIRGGGDVDVSAEYEDLCEAADNATKITYMQSWTLLGKRQYRPALVLGSAMPFFQAMTGYAAVIVFVPIFFTTLGDTHEEALQKALIISGVKIAMTLLSMVLVDRLGRRVLLLEGSIQSAASLMATAGVVGWAFNTYGEDLPDSVGIAVLITICFYVGGYSTSWGSLAWLVAAEVVPLETRAAGFSLGIAIYYVVTFVLSQTFLSMLCALEWGIFVFYGGWIIAMSAFVVLLLPETRGVPIEEMYVVWAKHWFWKRVVGEAGQQMLQLERQRTATRALSRQERGAGAEAAPEAAGGHAAGGGASFKDGKEDSASDG